MKEFKVGMIGFGFIGKVHAYGYETLKFYYPDAPFRCKIAGVCTSREETARTAKKEYGIEFATTDFKDLIDKQDIEIIDISSPNIFHLEQILYAIEKNKHIYCEKPIVCDYTEAKRVEEKLKNFKQKHQVVFHNRFFPSTLKTKQLIEDGFIGKPTVFRIAYYHSGSVDPKKPIGWKQEKGAGVLLDLGSHTLDLIYYFLGNYKSVCGKSKILYPERPAKDGKMIKVEVEDHIIINAEMENGATGIIEASKIATGTEDELKYEIYGTEGCIRYNSMQPNYLEVYTIKDKGFTKIPTLGNYPESNFPGPKFSVGWTRGHIHSIYNFIKAIYENQQASPSFYDGIYNMKVIEAVKNSLKEKKWQAI